MSEPIKLPPLPRPPIHLSGWTNELCEWAKDYARLAVEQNTEALRADAERWRAFAADDLGYMREPLVNARTGETVPGQVRWTIWWHGPDVSLFRDAIDAARVALKEAK